MKKFYLLLAFSLVCATVFSYNWKPQTNEQLRADMLEFCDTIRADAAGTRAGRMVARFERRQKRHLDDPYRWIGDCIDVVTRLKEIYPPVPDDGSKDALIRRDIFRLLDFPLHFNDKAPVASEEDKAMFEKVKTAYLDAACRKTLEFLDAPAPAPGKVSIFRVYNMGYVFRTSERTFGIDIKWQGSEEGARKVAERIDALFLTHPHNDHFNVRMFDAVTAAGKPLVLPCSPVVDFTHPDAVVLDHDVLEPMDIAGLKVTVLHGYQSKGVPNNVYVFDFDGWRIVHSGDNRDWDKQALLSGMPCADVLISATWAEAKRIMSAAMSAPGAEDGHLLYIPSHENELGHTVDHRESYRELFTLPVRLGDPAFTYPRVEIVEIGESITLSK